MHSEINSDDGTKKRKAFLVLDCEEESAEEEESEEEEEDTDEEEEGEEEEDSEEDEELGAEEEEEEEEDAEDDTDEGEEEEEGKAESAPVFGGGAVFFAVHSIKNKRQKRGAGGLEYLVHWSGVDKCGKPYRDSWEPVSGLAGCQWAIDQFEKVAKGDQAYVLISD